MVRWTRKRRKFAIKMSLKKKREEKEIFFNKIIKKRKKNEENFDALYIFFVNI